MNINGYTITYNDYWGEWCADHEIVGPMYFRTLSDALEYARNG